MELLCQEASRRGLRGLNVMGHTGSVQLHPNRSGGMREWRDEFAEPEFDTIDRKLCEQHRQYLLGEGFQECELLGGAQLNDPFRHLGIIDDLSNIVRNVPWFGVRLELEVDGQGLWATPFFG